MTALSLIDGASIARVSFPSTVIAETVDTQLTQLSASLRDEGARDVEVDLAEVNFMEPAALQMLISAVLQMRRKDMHVTLRIPQNRRMRDFWRAWGFPDALNQALGRNEFARIVAPADRSLFGEKQTHYLPIHLPAHPGFPGDAVRSSNFYGFHTERLEPRVRTTRPAYVEKDSWNVAHIRTVLDNKLGAGSSYFSSRIVFEAMLNALTHPYAAVVQTASLDIRNKAGQSSFTTHFWDDGLSMGETLSKAIDAGTVSHGEVVEDFDRKYLLVCSSDDRPGEEVEVVRGSTLVLSPGLPPHKALFATLLPGVTSDPQGRNHAVAPETVDEDVRYGRRGMGLYVLVNAVAEVLGGSVSFRTGRYFMNVRRTTKTEAAKYDGAAIRVRIKERPDVLPPFLGNLVTVRLNTREAQ